MNTQQRMMTTTTQVERMAVAAADEAIQMGATAPWGDGETLAGEDADALRGASRETLRAYDRAFRARIDERAPARAPVRGYAQESTAAVLKDMQVEEPI